MVESRIAVLMILPFPRNIFQAGISAPLRSLEATMWGISEYYQMPVLFNHEKLLLVKVTFYFSLYCIQLTHFPGNDGAFIVHQNL